MKNQNLLPQKAKNRFFVTSFWVVFLFIFSFLLGSSGVEAKTINLGDQPTDIINVIGQLGIKTGAPSALLEIASSTNKEGLRIITSNYSPFIIRNAANTADLFRIDQNGNIIGGNAGVWNLNGTNLYPNNTSYNVGIGTTNPGAKLDVVGGVIRTNNQLISTVANGTAPLAVTSATKVTNLNADLLDGIDSSSLTLKNDMDNLGTVSFNQAETTTAAFITKLEELGAFNNFHSVMKASWSYAGNTNITDTGFGELELAGAVVETWTDNSSDTVRGNITVRVTRPTVGTGGQQILVYNDQGSGYSPGWRQIWTSATDGANSGLDADLWDGNQFASYLNQAVLTTSNPTFGDVTVNGGDLAINNNNGGITFNDASAYWLKTSTNWGIYWDTAANQIKFNGSGTTRASIDLDDGAAYFNGSFGVGIADPLDKLHVAGNVRISGLLNCSGANSAVKTDTSGRLICGTVAGGVTGSGTANYVARWTAASTLGVGSIYDNGSVGIGTTSPGLFKLNVAGRGSFDSGKVTTDIGNITAESFLDLSNTIYKLDPSNTGSSLNVAGSIYGGGIIGMNGTGNSYLMGKLGIGKTAPAHALDVVGVINATTGYRFNNVATAGQYLRGNGTNFVASAIQASDVPILNQNTTGSAGSAAVLTHEDNRVVLPSELGINRLKFGFTSYGNNNGSPYADFLHMRSYQDDTGGNDNLVVFNKSGLGMRIYQQTFGSTSPYTTYKDVMLSDNGPTANYITKYTNTGTTVSAGKSIIYDNGTNVGISTNDPKDKLHVAGNVSISGLLNCSGANSAVKTDASGRLICGTISGGVTGSGTANYSTRWTGSSTLGTGVLYDNGASVGIGTSGPLSNLDVVGTFRAGSSGGGVRFNDDGAAAYFQALSSANGARDMFLKARNLIFHTGNPYSERLRIDSNGNVGIGIANPTQKLTISGTSIASETAQTNISAYANNGLRIVGNGSAGSQDAITYQAGGSGGGAAIAFRRDSSYGTYIDFYTNTSSVTGGIARAMTINRYGRVGIGTSTPRVDSKLDVAGNVYALGFNYGSDIRLKKNIKDIDNPLHKILNLRGVTFDWRADGRPSLGLIAQEVEKVFPELVSQGEGMKAVQYGNLVAPLIEAVKEQQRIISNLEARIMILEKQIN